MGEPPVYLVGIEEGEKADKKKSAAACDSSQEYSGTISWPKNPNYHLSQRRLQLPTIVRKWSYGEKRDWKEGWKIKSNRDE